MARTQRSCQDWATAGRSVCAMRLVSVLFAVPSVGAVESVGIAVSVGAAASVEAAPSVEAVASVAVAVTFAVALAISAVLDNVPNDDVVVLLSGVYVDAETMVSVDVTLRAAMYEVNVPLYVVRGTPEVGTAADV